MTASKSYSDRIYLTCVYVFLTFVFAITFYPFWNILVLSLNSADDSVRGGIYLWPRAINFDSYKQILQDAEILNGLKVTVLRTLIGTPLALAVISLLAFALSKRDLVYGRTITLFFIFTMYFGGGLIPYYMILKNVHLIDSFMVYIFPNLMNVFFVIIVRTFMQELPLEVEESAKMDGANDVQIYWRIILPICVPVLVTIGLFSAINHWNSWFDSYVFTYKPNLKTLQAVLVKILNQYQTESFTSSANQMADSAKRNAVSSDTIRMAATMVATLPIIMVYPFLQRYFVKGMTLGAVKS
ncbi:carbohydrate ABC transporter permease [Paenibacillus sacheonensis]|uniref:ABC transporter permease subunit n=1 Tax=Paenibacillus sacheonensis TaxID=742054 RepID=A0A7X4YM47_9BACL|nr:carbohydrate ABC transporter permease [Paenibacillus sacheonensis]MBM7565778.1 putative aldouronate transport system permease protein [Paenibacillus sacheonensis]NBC68900.1 ABC transporter permease subunit [Paenibacillus sacheonensis]